MKLKNKRLMSSTAKLSCLYSLRRGSEDNSGEFPRVNTSPARFHCATLHYILHIYKRFSRLNFANSQNTYAFFNFANVPQHDVPAINLNLQH